MEGYSPERLLCHHAWTSRCATHLALQAEGNADADKPSWKEAHGSFQRPGQNEMNIATGCPMFVRIDHLLSGGFVKDDTVFFKIVVDPPRVVP